MFRLLKNKNFTILLVARFLSSMGNSFYTVAAMWLVYSMGGSTLYTGLALFLTSIPAIFQLFLGPLIDLFPIKKILIFTQIIHVILLLLIPMLSILGYLTITVVLIVMPLVSFFNQFLYPTELSALPKLLKVDDLPKGNTLFFFAYQGSRAIFDSVAGVVVTVIGAVSMFYINSLTFVLSILTLMALSMPFASPRKSNISLKYQIKSYLDELSIGFNILKRNIFISILVGIVFLNLTGVAINAVLPGFTSSNGNIGLYGSYLSASAVGVLMGAFLASLKYFQNLKLGKIYALLILINGISLLLIGVSGNNVFSVILYCIAWGCTGMMNVFSQTMIQALVEKEFIGRVMSAAMGLSVGVAPVGALLGGLIGAQYGDGILIMISGFIVVLVSVYWIINKNTRNLPSIIKMSPSIVERKLKAQIR
ncbi:MFS transporter [Oceanobacillus sp. AG]|uniref:MFS transporter n=1 Tax=Oceanobacillus sp. AG TaxID=2681969 RepID=UPI0012EB16E6|nr:MFS transporter [Oceanobacillus sp. AG]